MEIKPSMIVKKDGKLGTVVQEFQGTKLKFLPVKYGRYYSSDLETITSDDVEIANMNEMVQFEFEEFNWGKIINIHTVGDYLIFEYTPESNGIPEDKISFHPYILKDGYYDDTNHSYNSLDAALVGVMAIKYDGINSQAAHFFNKMIGIK